MGIVPNPSNEFEALDVCVSTSNTKASIYLAKMAVFLTDCLSLYRHSSRLRTKKGDGEVVGEDPANAIEALNDFSVSKFDFATYC